MLVESIVTEPRTRHRRGVGRAPSGDPCDCLHALISSYLHLYRQESGEGAPGNLHIPAALEERVHGARFRMYCCITSGILIAGEILSVRGHSKRQGMQRQNGLRAFTGDVAGAQWMCSHSGRT